MSRLYFVLMLVLVAMLTSDKSFAQSSNQSPMKAMLLVANKGDESLGIIDPTQPRQLATVAEGGTTGHEVVASPDGRTAYVPIYGNAGVGKPGTDGRTVVAIDLQSRKIVGTVDFGRGVRPHFPVIGPRNKLLYVTTELDNSVSIIDPATLKVIGAVPTGQPESHMLAISRDGRRGYTSNVGPGTVSVLDLEARKTVAVIPISPVAQRISLSVDDKLAFTADQTSPRLAVIDTTTNKLKNWVTMPSTGYGTAATPDGRWLLVALPKVNKVGVLDLAKMEIVRTLDVPATPQAVIVRPDGREAYVSCDASGRVAAIDLTEWKVARIIEAGRGADGLAWAAPQ